MILSLREALSQYTQLRKADPDYHTTLEAESKYIEYLELKLDEMRPGGSK